MKILSLDTSGTTQSVALLEDQSLVVSKHQEASLSHSEILISTVQDLLKQARWALTDIELFALTHGPGSFTGLRIGMSTLKGLAWESQKPVVGVDTLKALAASLFSDEALAKKEFPVLAVFDARMEEVYAAVYNLSSSKTDPLEIKALIPPQVISVTELLKKLAKLEQKGRIVGNAWQAYPKLLEDSGWVLASQDPKFHQVQAYWVGRLALQDFLSNNFKKISQLKPQYLRASTAEILNKSL